MPGLIPARRANSCSRRSQVKIGQEHGREQREKTAHDFPSGWLGEPLDKNRQSLPDNGRSCKPVAWGTPVVDVRLYQTTTACLE